MVINGIIYCVMVVICLMFLKIINFKIIISIISEVKGGIENVLFIFVVIEFVCIFGLSIFIVSSVVKVKIRVYYFFFMFFLI